MSGDWTRNRSRESVQRIARACSVSMSLRRGTIPMRTRARCVHAHARCVHAHARCVHAHAQRARARRPTRHEPRATPSRHKPRATERRAREGLLPPLGAEQGAARETPARRAHWPDGRWHPPRNSAGCHPPRDPAAGPRGGGGRPDSTAPAAGCGGGDAPPRQGASDSGRPADRRAMARDAATQSVSRLSATAVGQCPRLQLVS